jgi:acetyltransferase-like isoleucine patch superfamily enzyme
MPVPIEPSRSGQSAPVAPNGNGARPAAAPPADPRKLVRNRDAEARPAKSPPLEPGEPIDLRRAPQPMRGGPRVLLRFMRARGMLNHRYAFLIARWLWLKLRWRGRMQTDGLCFVTPGVKFEIGRDARIRLGRWCWIGHDTKLRVHEGELSIGAKTVIGQECTLSVYRLVEIGRECIIADRTMFIDFDHGTADVDRPVREQGIYMEPVRVGNNVWIGYGACFLRGVKVGDNSVVGANAVVCGDVPADAVVGGVPARLLRMREHPRRMRWE